MAPIFLNLTGFLCSACFILALALRFCESKPAFEIETTKNNRTERLFGLIRINNIACTNDEQKVGVCLDKKECLKKGGTSIGSCAQGFGTCCAIVLRCAGSQTEIYTLERVFSMSNNQGTQDCSYEIAKPSDKFCQIELDLLTFTFDNPDEIGDCKGASAMRIEQSFTVNRFRLCGSQLRQKLYLTYGSARRIRVLFRTSNDNRYDIRVKQITCEEKIVPDNCLQFLSDSDGIIKSFGYPSYMINNPDYNVCVRNTPEDTRIAWKQGTVAECTSSEFILSRYFTSTVPPTAALPVRRAPITGKPNCAAMSHVEFYGEDYHCGAHLVAGFPVESVVKPFMFSVRTVPDVWMAVPMYMVFTHARLPAPPGTALMPVCGDILETAATHGFHLNCVLGTTPPEPSPIAPCVCTKVTVEPLIGMVNRTGFCLHYSVK